MIKGVESADELAELFGYSCVQGEFAVRFKVFEEVVVETSFLQGIGLTFFDFLVETMEFFSVLGRV